MRKMALLLTQLPLMGWLLLAVPGVSLADGRRSAEPGAGLAGIDRSAFAGETDTWAALHLAPALWNEDARALEERGELLAALRARELAMLCTQVHEFLNLATSMERTRRALREPAQRDESVAEAQLWVEAESRRAQAGLERLLLRFEGRVDVATQAFRDSELPVAERLALSDRSARLRDLPRQAWQQLAFARERP